MVFSFPCFLGAPWDVWQTWMLSLRLHDKKIGCFHRKTGVVFQSAVYAVHWRWYPVNSCFSDCFQPVVPDMHSSLATRVRQSRSILCVGCFCLLAVTYWGWVLPSPTRVGHAATVEHGGWAPGYPTPEYRLWLLYSYSITSMCVYIIF